MTRKPISLDQDADVIDAIKIFNTHKISCIPVIDKEARPIGMVSWRDILKQLDQQ
jgi:acetoin utilization protein AcuB